MITDSTTGQRRRDTLDGLWRAGSSASALIGLSALLTATLIVAAIFPQQPGGLEPAAAQQWLLTTATSYRSFGPLLRALGAFNVFEGTWIRILLAVFAYLLLLRLADQGRAVWHMLRRTPALPPLPTGLPAQEVTLPAPLGLALARVQDVLRRRFHTVIVESTPAQGQIYAERRRCGAVGPLLIYLGLLGLLLGLLIQDVAGWQMADIALAPAGHTTLARGGRLQITLDGIAGPESVEDPRQGDAVSTVTLTQADGHSCTVHIGHSRTARCGNLWIVQRATGPALAVSARDGAGRGLMLQSLAPGGEVSAEIHLLFRQTQTEQAFAEPTRNIAFRVVSYTALPEREINAPVFLVEAYRGDNPDPLLSQLVQDTATIALDDVVYTLQRDRHAVFEVAYLPGLWLLLFGGLLILAGAILALGWRHSQIWVNTAVRDDSVRVVIRGLALVGSQTETARLVRELSNPICNG
jgi:cytochrome c biogenesis protein ResB